MCKSCDKCFTKKEKQMLRAMKWSEKQIDYAENSVIEEKIKELL